ncbi:MAG: hypothetical protein ABFS14_08385 [Gemmatimonadota bacterium]
MSPDHDSLAQPPALSGIPPGPDLSGRQLEAVIQRAAELQLHRTEAADRLSDDEVVRIADEVGLEERYVRQALAETRANALVPSRPSDRSLAVRAWGSAHVQFTRVVTGSPAQVLSKLEEYFEAQATLRRVRDQRERQIWEPATDLLSQLQRGFDVGGKGYELAKARRVEVMVEPLESDRSLVTLRADLSNQRRGHAIGWLIGAAAIGAPVAAILIAQAGFPPLLTLPLSGAVAGLATLFTRATFRRQRAKVEIVIEGLLDRIERGSELSVVRRRTWSQRLAGLFEDN